MWSKTAVTNPHFYLSRPERRISLNRLEFVPKEQAATPVQKASLLHLLAGDS